MAATVVRQLACVRSPAEADNACSSSTAAVCNARLTSRARRQGSGGSVACWATANPDLKPGGRGEMQLGGSDWGDAGGRGRGLGWGPGDVSLKPPRQQEQLPGRCDDRVRRPVPKRRIAERWREIQGEKDWAGMLDPLDADLRAELVRYGEMAQATYDAFDSDITSRYCGSCKFDQDKLLEAVGLPDSGYRVTKYIYATAQDLHLPAFFRRPDVEEDAWSKDSNWVGFVAVCSADGEIGRQGRRDILVAWRGTVTALEWKENVRDYLTPMQADPAGHGVPLKGPITGNTLPVSLDVKVEKGFWHMYTSRNPDTRYNKLSAQEQVMQEVERLVTLHGGEELSVTVTGHSLGGAWALLCAYDIAAAGLNRERYGSGRGEFPVTVFNFAAPRVGNDAFRDRLEKELKVKVLRVVNETDSVPNFPGFFTNEKVPWLSDFLDWLPWTYSHVGKELRVDSTYSTCLDQSKSDLVSNHSMELYLHLLDAFKSRAEPFGNFHLETSRDVALLNKYDDILHRRYRVPGFWWQEKNKGLVYDRCKQRWRQRERDPDDIPVNIPRQLQSS